MTGTVAVSPKHKQKRHPRVPFLFDSAGIELTIADVHGHFETETHFSSSWLGPHDDSPLGLFNQAIA
jgi:hypothetical protein